MLSKRACHRAVLTYMLLYGLIWQELAACAPTERVYKLNCVLALCCAAAEAGQAGGGWHLGGAGRSERGV